MMDVPIDKFLVYMLCSANHLIYIVLTRGVVIVEVFIIRKYFLG
jgi:hypothetical protein